MASITSYLASCNVEYATLNAKEISQGDPPVTSCHVSHESVQWCRLRTCKPSKCATQMKQGVHLAAAADPGHCNIACGNAFV